MRFGYGLSGWSRRSYPSSAAEAPVSRRPAVGRDGTRRACAVADNAPMHVIAVVAALVAAAIHVWFFVLESVQFTRPTVFARFGIRSAEDAAIVRPMAFNQGFYNLFLAIGIVAGPGTRRLRVRSMPVARSCCSPARRWSGPASSCS